MASIAAFIGAVAALVGAVAILIREDTIAFTYLKKAFNLPRRRLRACTAP
jgi:hypothetical protein